MPRHVPPLVRPLVLMALLVVAAPIAQGWVVMAYSSNTNGGTEVCIGVHAGPASFGVHTRNPYGASGPMPNPDDPLGPPDEWYVLVASGGGC